MTMNATEKCTLWKGQSEVYLRGFNGGGYSKAILISHPYVRLTKSEQQWWKMMAYSDPVKHLRWNILQK